MSDNGGSDNGGSDNSAWRGGPDPREPAFDPWLQPELFRGVLTRRVFAFLIDLVLLAIPIVLGVVFISVFGVVTLGLGWALFWLVSPASVIWALVYYGATLGGPSSATVGMRMMDLQMRTWYGEPSYFVMGAVHAILFWVSITMLSPFVLLVGLFNGRRRLLHDIVLGTVIINSAALGRDAQPLRSF
ncbi:putative RDD family membrane protein YckC [Rhodopseudomonas rhenobacensis]|uniref:Putative RDD family membrane protein YckC n=1 Tax=Rhodopseudomonas rhenobacensis TaxID=87461 RepID=A0A7W8DXF4_9BRAD|nr:RDD family protein [Rhodopseudomonas rhenobacensis]MBB5045692.1 putative RDD family membrane protein YckC [Rhodopseudomonas rhenobacensis]